VWTNKWGSRCTLRNLQYSSWYYYVSGILVLLLTLLYNIRNNINQLSCASRVPFRLFGRLRPTRTRTWAWKIYTVLFGSVDSRKSDFSCKMWKNCCVMIVVRKLKSVWLKQLSTVDSIRNVCYAYEVLQDYLYVNW
jgi:hypothetical protein